MNNERMPAGGQMSCALRPLIGEASTFLPQERKFFLQHWIEQVKKPS